MVLMALRSPRKSNLNQIKALILTEGGKKYGLGHVQRCLSIKQALKENNINSEMIVDGDADSMESIFSDEKIKIGNWKKDVLKQEEADVVIIDSWFASNNIYENIVRNSRLAVFFDDVQRINYPGGIIVNGGIGSEEMNYKKYRNHKVLLGTKYQPLRREFWKTSTRKINGKINNVLLFFGVNDSRGLAPKILKSIQQYFPDWDVTIILGKGVLKSTLNKLDKYKKDNVNIFVNINAKLIKNLMIQADVAIVSAGQIIYELACMGVPTIGISTASNQNKYIQAWENKGFVINGGVWNQAALEKNIINSLTDLEDGKRKQRSLKGQSLIDGQGARRIVGEIQKII